MARPMTRMFAVFTLAALIAAGSPASSDSAPLDTTHPWILGASDPARLLTALDEHVDKTPVEFFDRLDHALPDGTLRIMATMETRDPGVEGLVEANTEWLYWYGEEPFFLARVTPDQILTFLEDPNVRFVEPDYPLSYFVSSGTVDINASSVYNTGTGSGDGTGVWYYDTSTNTLEDDGVGSLVTGKGVTIAFNDGGIDLTHRDFGGWNCVATTYEPCDSRIKAAVTNPIIGLSGSGLPTTEAASGHGAHVAGIGAGNAYYQRHQGGPSTTFGGDGFVMGVAPEASIVSIKNGDTLWAGLAADALRWTYNFKFVHDINVSSNSWGCLGGCEYNPGSVASQYSKLLYHRDVVVVFAVGNDGGSGSGDEFSGYAQSPYVLGVAAHNDATQQITGFSSRGDSTTSNSLPSASTWDPTTENVNKARRPDLTAPGESIWAARTLTGGAASIEPRITRADIDMEPMLGTLPYVQMRGTSMSTPHVAGAAALLFDACPGSSALDVMRALMDTADPLPGYVPYEQGYGKVDVRGAIDSLC